MAAPITTVASSLEGQAFEIALEMQKAELAIPGEDRPNNVIITFDTENQVTTFSVTLQTTVSIVDGKAEIAPIPYLNSFTA